MNKKAFALERSLVMGHYRRLVGYPLLYIIRCNQANLDPFCLPLPQPP